MDPTDLAFAGVARQAELMREGEVSSRELVELYLERIERLDPQLNAFRVVTAERALAEADQADARRRADGDRPLLGVPLAVKDNMDVAGEVSANGGRSHGGPATEDTDMVKRLRNAGAVIIGKTNLPELAILGVTESTAFGMTRNPWDTERTTGGSSGGSGAAVAAGLVAGATASDGAGSIRIPAACCGVFGLKPQRDCISLAPDREHWYGLSAYGFHSRRVADTALMLDLCKDQPRSRPFAEAASTPPGPLRVAVSFKPAVDGVPVHPDIRRAVNETADVLRSLGHEVTERDPALGALGPLSLIPRYFGGIAQEAARVPHPERLERRTKGYARMGAPYRGAVIERVKRDEAKHVERINRLFDDHDVLLTPVLAKPPVDVGRWEGLGAVRTFVGQLFAYPFTGTWNATGQPAASIPAGFTGDGVPLSAQLISRPNDEATLLSLAGQIEAETAWPDQRPPVS
jgi:amidase